LLGLWCEWHILDHVVNTLQQQQQQQEQNTKDGKTNHQQQELEPELVLSCILQRQLEVEIVQELIAHPPPNEFLQWSDVDNSVKEWILLMKRYPSWAYCLREHFQTKQT
jgi:hypothetical protein